MNRSVNVVGWGGGAQTYIMKFMLREFNWKLNTLADKNSEKHCQYGLKKQYGLKNGIAETTNYIRLKKQTTFYVYSCPVKCIASHYRRAWHQLQKIKMTGVYEKLPSSLGEYENLVVSEKRDPFMLYHHFVGWSYCPNFYPIILEDLIQYKKELANHFELNVSHFDNIQIAKRNSKMSTNLKYNSFYEEIYDKIRKEAKQILLEKIG
jgi:hypothetical protein